MAAHDRYGTFGRKPAGGPRKLAEVTPNDATDLATVTQWIYLGGGGNLRVTMAEGGTVTLMNLFAGWHALEVARVHATGTTATNIVAGW